MKETSAACAVGRNVVATLHRPEYSLLISMLKEARQDAGLTQSELARRAGMSQPRMWDIEAERRRMDALELLDLLRALSISAPDFIADYEKRAANLGK